MPACPVLVRHCLLYIVNKSAGKDIKKKKKFKEKENSDERAISVTNGCRSFVVSIFL